MKRRILSICLALAMCLALLAATALAAPGDTYLALGDSITTGYAPDGKVERPFADQVAAAQGYTLDNKAEDGETSATLKEKLATPGSEELAAAASADLITITIGGNDLMGALYDYLAEKWSADHTDDPKTAQEIQAMLINLNPADLGNLQILVGYLSGFASSSQAITALQGFTTNLTAIVGAIKQVNSTATILVATQYNPYYYLAKTYCSFFPQAQTISNAFEAGLTVLNGTIRTVAGQTGATVVDVYQAFQAAVDGTPSVNPCNPSMSTLDFHPNQTGHDLIAGAINGKLPTQNYDLWVGGTRVTSRNANDVLDDGTVSYDAAANTLTLDNAYLTLPEGSDRGANIVVIGDNTITAVGEKHCILSKAAGLTFSQDGDTPGELTARAEGTHACIVSESGCDATFQSGTYDLYAEESNVITAGKKMHITGTAEITAKSNGDDTAPVIGGHPVIIDGDSRLIVDTTGCAITCSCEEGYAFKLAGNAYVSIDGARGNYNVDLLSSPSDDMLITNHATLECRSHNTYYEDWGYYNPVIYPGGSLYISDSASVTVEGPGDVIAPWGNLVFTGGTLTTVSQTAYGVWAPEGNIQISGPTTVLNTFTRDNDGKIVPSFRGIGAKYDVSIIDGATVNAQTKDGLAIYSINKTNISGSVVDLGAEDGAKYYALWASGGLTIEDSWVRTDGVNAAPAATDSVYICDDTGSVYGTAAVPVDREIPAGTTLTIPADAVLTVPDGVTLTNSGALTVEGILEVGSAAALTGAADVSGRVYVLEAEGGANPVNGVTFTLSNSGQVYAQRTELEGTAIQPAARTAGSYSYTLANGGKETFTNLWNYYTAPSGSSDPTGDYLVNVDRTTGGRVTVSPGRADKGDTVTITVKPDEGYVLDELTVTAKDGGSVKLTWKDDNKCTFTMPGSQVTVEAAFVKDDGQQPAAGLPFVDVTTSDWYYDAVEYIYENDLMNGTSANTFSPFVTTSRAMMLTILARYDGVDTSTGSTWYEAGAVWAIAEGVSDGTNLEANLTREQLVTMLWRYAGSPEAEGNLSGYPDSASVSDWAVNAMIWAVDNGIITGNGVGALDPQGTATRAEVATILMRF